MEFSFLPPKNLSPGQLIKEVEKFCRVEDVENIQRAYDFAKKAHEGQTRRSGEPYINHPLAAAYILSKMRIDSNIIVAALLHDIPEDTRVTLETLEKEFGADVAKMVEGITKLGKLKYRGVERYIENLRKMFVAMAEDVRVMLIKFADRTHNLLTLGAQPPSKQYRIALETLEIYAPIASRLGIAEFKSALEDLSFPYVYPKDYERVRGIRDSSIEKESQYLKVIMDKLTKEVKATGIKIVDVHGRKKQLYSLYRKLLQKNWQKTKIYDITAVGVIVNDLNDCYAVLGIIHKNWPPVKGRIKDYISQPKPNGYRSLHTTVFCNDGRIVEFQIRTWEMHEEAEYGVAAHWHYDERGVIKITQKNIVWAKELAKIQKDILNNLTDLEEMKIDFFQNRIFVFTPNGDVIDLPEDATAIDFAYNIHTEIGNKCTGALINDQMESLETPLKNGDVVEIIVDKKRKGPNPDWLAFVKTSIAKSSIKSALNANKKNWLKNIIPPKSTK